MDESNDTDLLDAHIGCCQLCQAEEADKVLSGKVGDVQTSFQVLQD